MRTGGEEKEGRRRDKEISEEGRKGLRYSKNLVQNKRTMREKHNSFENDK